MLVLGQPLVASAPTTSYEGVYSTVNDNSLVAFIAPNGPTTNDMTKDEITDLIRRKYPEMANLLICIARQESQFNRYALGDSGLAHGLYQIHIDKHPVTEWCAFDVECSLDFTARMIKNGYGFKWSTYKYCL